MTGKHDDRKIVEDIRWITTRQIDHSSVSSSSLILLLPAGLREEIELMRKSKTTRMSTYLKVPTTTAWSRSYGSNVICSLGLSFSLCNFFTSSAKTASGAAVESIQLAWMKVDRNDLSYFSFLTLMEITKLPLFFRKWCAFNATIRAWSGWATSAKMVSTKPEQKMKTFFDAPLFDS